jgi:hypothetical protein
MGKVIALVAVVSVGFVVGWIMGHFMGFASGLEHQREAKGA